MEYCKNKLSFFSKIATSVLCLSLLFSLSISCKSKFEVGNADTTDSRKTKKSKKTEASKDEDDPESDSEDEEDDDEDEIETNVAPNDISLSATSINENNAVNAVVGVVATVDENTSDTHSYSLVAGTGDTDNASFNVSGNNLRASAAFNYEAKSSYAIRLRTTETGAESLVFEEAFTVTVSNVNEAPTDIALSATSLNESLSSGTTVGSLSATDVDVGDTAAFTLVAGTGDTDNASFAISGTSLNTAAIFDYETKASYAIRVRITDGGTNTYEEQFTITVVDVSEPTEILLSLDDAANLGGAQIVWNGSQYGVVYSDSRLGDSNIYFTRVSAAGAQIGSETLLTIDDTSIANAPRIVWTGTEYGIVYTDDRLGDENLYFTRVSAAGAQVGGEVLLTVDDTFSAQEYRIVWTGSEYGLVYFDNRLGDYNVYFTRVSSAGAQVGGEVLLSTDDAFNAFGIQMIWTGTEYGVVFVDPALGDFNLYFTRVSAAGAQVGGTVLLTVDDAFNSLSPEIHWTGSEYGVVYFDNRLGDYNLYLTRVSAASVQFGGEILLTPDDAANLASAHSIWTGTEFAMAYTDTRLGDTNTYFTRVSAAGVQVEGEVLLSIDDSSSAGSPQIVWTGSEFGVVYIDGRLTDNNIYYTRVSPASVQLGSETLLTVDDNFAGYAPKIVWAGNQYAFLYIDDRLGDENTYFNTASGFGPATPDHVTFSQASANIYTTECQPVTLQSYDATGLLSLAPYTLNVSLAGGAGTFYKDSACTTSATSVNLIKNSYESKFYYKNANAESINLTATPEAASGLTDDAIAVTTAAYVGQVAATTLKSAAAIPGISNDAFDMVWTGSEYGVVYSHNGLVDYNIYFARVSASGLIVGSEVLLSVNDSSDAFNSQISWTGSEYGIVYTDDRLGDYNMYFTRVSAAGLQLGGEILLTVDDSASAFTPQIVWTGSEFGVVYSDDRLGDSNIYFTRVSAAGAQIGGEVLLSVDDAANTNTPRLVWTGSEFGVIHADNRLGDDNLYFTRVSAAGSQLGGEVLLTPDDTASALGYQIAWTGSEYGIVYYDDRLGDSNIYFTRVSAAGAQIGNELLLTPDDTSYAEDVQIVWTGSEFGIVYYDDRLGDANIYFTAVSAAGIKLGSETLLTLDDTSNAVDPDIVWTGSEYGVVYYDDRLGDANIYLSRVAVSGARIGAEILLSPSDINSAAFPLLIWSNERYATIFFDNYDSFQDLATFLNFRTVEGAGNSEPDNIQIVKGQSEVKASECVRYTLSLKDDRGATSTSPFTFGLELSGELDGDFYSDSSCTTLSATSILLEGKEEAVFYFKDADDTDAPTFTVEDPFAILTTDTFNVDVIP